MMRTCVKPTALPTSIANTKGWILFDAACGICSRAVPFWQNTFTRLNLHPTPLQTPWVKDALQISDTELLAHFRLILQDGSLFEDADVYRYVLKHVWWGKPLYLISTIPGLAWLWDQAYLAFARNRYRVAQVCGLQKTIK